MSYKIPEDARECNRRWRKNNPLASKAHRYKTRYGLTMDQYNALLNQQNNKCAICKDSFSIAPCVDHNHTTGIVRGLLCKQCNTMVGMSKEKVESLKEAINYLSTQRAKCLS